MPGDGIIPQEITTAHVVVVEGKDEIVLFRHLLGERAAQLQFVDAQGKENIPKIIKLLPKIRGWALVTYLKVVRDADDDFQAAFDSIANALTSAQIEPPTRGGEFAGGSPRTGIFILPNNAETGDLERLCLSSVAGRAGTECIEPFFHCIANAGAIVNPGKQWKARMLTYLASTPEATKDVGYAAVRGQFNLQSPPFLAVKTFLETGT